LIVIASVIALFCHVNAYGQGAYNLFNSNVPLSYVTTYGATWKNPNTILDARFAKISAQIDF
jgi:hypothetical protein